MGIDRRNRSGPEAGSQRRNRQRGGKASATRLFVGIYPDVELARRALALLGGLDLPQHRLTMPEQVHLTLLFIGEVELKRAGVLEEIIESVRRAASGIGRFSLRPTRLIALPQRGPVRLIALETDLPGELVELHSRLARRLTRQARLRPTDRFLPHLTLCRFREPTARPGLREAAEKLAVELPAFETAEVRLMRSVLLPGGARHEKLLSVELSDTS